MSPRSPGGPGQRARPHACPDTRAHARRRGTQRRHPTAPHPHPGRVNGSAGRSPASQRIRAGQRRFGGRVDPLTPGSRASRARARGNKTHRHPAPCKAAEGRSRHPSTPRSHSTRVNPDNQPPDHTPPAPPPGPGPGPGTAEPTPTPTHPGNDPQVPDSLAGAAFAAWGDGSYGPAIFGSGASKLGGSVVAPLFALARGYRTLTQPDLRDLIADNGFHAMSVPAKQLRAAVGDRDALLMPWYTPTDVATYWAQPGLQDPDQWYDTRPSALQYRPHPANVVTDSRGKKAKYQNLAGQQTVMGRPPRHPSHLGHRRHPYPAGHRRPAEGRLGDHRLPTRVRRHRHRPDPRQRRGRAAGPQPHGPPTRAGRPGATVSCSCPSVGSACGGRTPNGHPCAPKATTCGSRSTATSPPRRKSGSRPRTCSGSSPPRAAPPCCWT